MPAISLPALPGALASATRVIIDGPVEVDPKHDAFDVAVGAAQIIGVLVAAVGVWYVYRQLRDQRADADEDRKKIQIERTLNVVQRYADPQLRKRVAKVGAYVGATNAATCVAHIAAWATAAHSEEESLPRATGSPRGPRASRNDVFAVLDFFEDLEAQYNEDLLHKRVFSRTIAPLPVGFLARAWWLVLWRRGHGPVRDSKYAELESMVRRLRSERPDLKEAERPAAKVSVLALPDREPQASAADWDRCKRLSHVLNEKLGAQDAKWHDRGESLREAVRSAGATAAGPAPGPKLWLLPVPTDLGDDRGRWQRQRSYLSGLEDCLNSLTVAGTEAAIQALGGSGPASAAP